MNRQQRRLLQRQGHITEDGLPAAPSREEVAERRRAAVRPVPGAPRRRTSPRQFLHEVNVELRKVRWPSTAETVNYSTVVFVTLALIMALIFGLDFLFTKLAVFLFK